MGKTVKSGKGDVEERILASATVLFANSGYNGVSTRDIASHAGVNEVTIYRHYPRKRDLYLAVLDSELQQVKLGVDLLSRITEARDANTALARTFDLLSATLLSRPALLRLIQFSALELEDDLDPLIRKHLSELIEVVVHYLEPWVACGELRCASARTLVLSLVGILLSHRSLNRLFPGSGPGPEAMFKSFVDSAAVQ